MNDRRARPNVLLLVMDSLRADAVEPYGARPGSSPTLAELARRGTAVPDVRSTASWTLPAHISMFTGELARGLGLGQAPHQTVQGAAPVVRAQRDRLLAAVLSSAGWQTKGLSANAWVGNRAGFDTGFEEFVELDSSRLGELGRTVRQRVKWDLEGVRGRGDDGAAEAEKVVSAWARGLKRRPFFWFINLVECHAPYLAPRPHDGVSALTRLRVADEAHRYLTFESNLRVWLGLQRVPDGVLARMRAQYAASVRYMDAWLERVLDALTRADAVEDTLVIVCADHGEHFGEAGLMTHGLSLNDCLLHVPFIVSGPGAEAFDGMLSLAELPWRLAAAVGLEEHPWSTGLPAGLPVAQWDPFALTKEGLADLAAKWHLDDEAIRKLTTPLTCATLGRLKLVRGAKESDEALYDIAIDPLEKSPIRDPQQMSSCAGNALANLRAAVAHPAAQATAEVTVAPDTLPPEEVEDLERKMRLLGYM